LYEWVHKARKAAPSAGGVVDKADAAEARRLKAELKRVTEERDILDNLARVSVTGGSTPRDHYYCYHASSRRLDFVRTGPVCTGTASPAVTTLGYDVQGNVLNKNGAGYTFDYGNRLRTAAGLTYRYDAHGRRVRQDSTGTQLKYSFYSQDGKLRWQRDKPASKRISNLYLAGSLVAELSRPIGSSVATVSYLHTDALGSPIARSNSSGVVTETSEYEPYGKLLNRPDDDRAGYTGHVMDAASGLTYMQQRYYDPQIGRFLSVDPVTAISTGGASFNRYWYANNSPYKFTDPDGRCADRYENGSCRVNVDPATGRAGVAAGKQLESQLNRNDKIVNALSDKAKLNIHDKNGKVIGSMTGKEVKAVWNGTSFNVRNTSYNNGGAGGGTRGNWSGYSFRGNSNLSPSAVSQYADAATVRGQSADVGISTLIFHELGHETHFGEALTRQFPVSDGFSWAREKGASSAGQSMSQAVGAPFNCAIAGGCSE
jgi:RHS repeat-associated protein